MGDDSTVQNVSPIGSRHIEMGDKWIAYGFIIASILVATVIGASVILGEKNDEEDIEEAPRTEWEDDI